MRTAFLMGLFLLLSNTNFCQDAETVKEINKLIAPEFKVSVNDTITCGFFEGYHQNDECLPIKELDIDGDGKKEIVAVAHNNVLDEDYARYAYKIFVFKKKINNYFLIDSSTRFCFAKGTNVEIKHDTIILNSLVHHAGYSFIYKINLPHHKYLLQQIKYFEVYNSHKYSNEIEEIYEINKQQLFVKSSFIFYNEPDKKKNKQKIKIIKIPLPSLFQRELKMFIDPYGDNNGNEIYSKVFLRYDDKRIVEMMRY